ncbi:MAG: phasin family protein [Pseudomonadota bacterium]
MQEYAKQAEEMIKKTQEMVMPEGVQKAMEENMNKTRDAYSKFSEMTEDATKAFEDVYTTAQQGTKEIADTLIAQTSENTKAAFAVAEAILQTKSVPEAAQIQAEFMKQQFEKLSEQSKEIYEISSKITADTAKSFNTATTQAFQQVK